MHPVCLITNRINVKSHFHSSGDSTRRADGDLPQHEWDSKGSKCRHRSPLLLCLLPSRCCTHTGQGTLAHAQTYIRCTGSWHACKDVSLSSSLPVNQCYLSICIQWKIRRVLAFSLHELARVLGTEQTCSDILPIFEDYSTKDCDDVKIGTLTHLTEFFEVRIVGWGRWFLVAGQMVQISMV